MKIAIPLLVALGIQAVDGKQSLLRKLVGESAKNLELKHLDKNNESRHLQDEFQLKVVGNNGLPTFAWPLGECEGDCDSDADCAGNLVCFKDETSVSVPGCIGVRALSKNGYTDYCTNPDPNRSGGTNDPNCDPDYDPNCKPSTNPPTPEPNPDCNNLVFGPAIATPPDFLFNTIMEIQSNELTSPFVGQTVVNVLGVVTAIDGQIFNIQDLVGDGLDDTSDAIEVFLDFSQGDPNALLDRGDIVNIAVSTVVEFIPDGNARSQPTTQLYVTDSNAIQVMDSGRALPTPVIIGSEGRIPPSESMIEGIKFWESLEGMLVKVRYPLAVSSTEDRPDPFPRDVYVVPDNGQFATGLSSRGALTISQNDYNPEKIKINMDPTIYGSTDNFYFPDADVGDTFDNVLGVVSYWNGDYGIVPVEHFGIWTDTTLTDTRTFCTPAPYTLLTGTYNVNFWDDYPNGGFDQIQTFNAFASHIDFNMGSPDVVGLQEVGNDQNLQLLMAALGARQKTFDYIYLNQNLAIIYNPHRVKAVLDGSFGSSAQWVTFKYLPTLQDFTVANLYLTDKSGSLSITGVNQEWADLQEMNEVNAGLAARLAEVAAVRNGLATLAAPIVLGTMNDFQWVSPLLSLELFALRNLIYDIPANDRYSEIVEGNARAVDHILVSATFCPGAKGEYIRINSEYFDWWSDHDPMVACIDLWQ